MNAADLAYRLLLFDWMEQALCSEIDPELWFPDTQRHGSANDNTAMRICRSCEVQMKCFNFAMENDIRYGIYGATTARQRRKLTKQKEQRA
jgi:WhiB family redox-sensing transcriptional regulator